MRIELIIGFLDLFKDSLGQGTQTRYVKCRKDTGRLNMVD